MKNKAFLSPPAVGISSLLVIFAVLCLSVFTLLSISTVQADTLLAEKNRQAVMDYYLADCHAQNILARLRAGEVPQGVNAQDGQYHYYCQQSATQALFVRVDAQDLRVLEYRSVSTLDWQAEDKILVWDGQEEKEE